MTTTAPTSDLVDVDWYARSPEDTTTALTVDPVRGLTTADAAARTAQYGPNQITAEKPPSVWAIALQQLRDPMNIMLVAVTVVSFAIGEVSTGIIVAALIVLNLVLGSRQELKARASVDALSNLQVPQAKVLRDGTLVLVPAVDVGARRHRAGGGGRHHPGRRTTPPLGDARDPGGRTHRGERPGPEGCAHADRR